MCNIQFRDLKIKDYLFEGNVNTKVSKFVFKARSKNLDIKLFKKWKYTDKLCTGCGENEESESELSTPSSNSSSKFQAEAKFTISY